ncbi:MAG: hypothetical protein AAGJ37_05185 [Pseudomonadota bacterium]
MEKIGLNTIEPTFQVSPYEKFKTEWESFITDGNRAFSAGALNTAESCYSEASKTARYLLDQGYVNKASISMLLVGYHNSADLYIRKNDPETALDRLSTALRTLFNFPEECIDCEQKRDALEWGTIRAKRQLCLFLKSHPTMQQQQLDFLTSQCLKTDHH